MQVDEAMEGAIVQAETKVASLRQPKVSQHLPRETSGADGSASIFEGNLESCRVREDEEAVGYGASLSVGKHLK